jgi:hypothetical protein
MPFAIIGAIAIGGRLLTAASADIVNDQLDVFRYRCAGHIDPFSAFYSII